MNSDTSSGKSFKELLAAPKGHMDYVEGEAFLLHVFWEAPSQEAALELLRGLQICAAATNRDTPCTTTYFFRISHNGLAFASPRPKLVRDFPVLTTMKRKVRVGSPLLRIHQEMEQRKLDPSLLSLDDDDELPAEVQGKIQPVVLEFTEVYLDERAFMEHAQSRSFLDGYKVIMDPSAQFKTPETFRMGTPTAKVIDTILDPILKAQEWPMHADAESFFIKSSLLNQEEQPAVFVSLDFEVSQIQAPMSKDTFLSYFPSELRSHTSLFVSFAHPYLENVWRVLLIAVSLPTDNLWIQWKENLSNASVKYLRGEMHCTATYSDELAESWRTALANLHPSWTEIVVNATPCVGFVLHPKAGIIQGHA
jgi:hypothetical protein